MNKLAEQLLADFKPLIKKSAWDETIKQLESDIMYHGEIIKIEDVVDENGNIERRKYIFADDKEGQGAWQLTAARARFGFSALPPRIES